MLDIDPITQVMIYPYICTYLKHIDGDGTFLLSDLANDIACSFHIA